MKLETKIGASFVLALLAVLLVGSLVFANNRALLRQNGWVIHTYDVLDRINGLFDDAQQIESGMRGFVLTGRPEFLDVFQKSVDAVDGKLRELRALVSDNPPQIARVDAFGILLHRKITLSQERIESRRAGGLEGAVAGMQGQGKQAMDSLRAVAAEMRGVELSLLDEREKQSARSARNVAAALGALMAVAVLLLAVFYFLVRKDLFERQRIATLLEANEQRFRAVLESAPDALALTDRAGAITLVNSAFARLFGVGAESAPGRPLKEFLRARAAAVAAPGAGGAPDAGETAALADPVLEKIVGPALAARTGAGHAEEGVWQRSEGLTMPRFDGLRGGDEAAAFPAEISSSSLRLAEGTEATITAIRDLTERVQAEGELRRYSEDLARSNTELERFAYVASHDLQEPLRMVSSYTQLLGRRYRGKLGADADDFINFAVDGANRMQKLINDLLSYSRVGSRPLELEAVNCETVLAQVLRDMEGTLEVRGAVVERAAPLPAVRGDATQIGQLFQNLVGNATKFARPDVPPRLGIHAEAVAVGPQQIPFWRFAFQDNGIGIDPQYYERIFVIFQRLHGKDQYPGTGIGLAICKKIVEGHGGRLWVESQPGQGANFFFTLPAADV